MERDPKATALLVREYELATCGTEQWHKHYLGLVYTDGLKFVADVCGAFWLLDAVASWQPKIVKAMEEHKLRPFQVWRLHFCPHARSEPEWVLDCWSDTPGYKGGEDGPASIELASQAIGYSDFPVGLSPFEFWVEGNVALLKGEH